MKIKISTLKRVIKEELDKQHLSFDQIKVQFPDAYSQLLSGQWEDNDGRIVKNQRQLERWLQDDDFFSENGKLHWFNQFEGDQVWSGSDWYPADAEETIQEAIEPTPDFDRMQQLDPGSVMTQYRQAWNTALDADGPAGDEVDRDELVWFLDGTALYAYIEGADPSTGSTWTPEVGWEPLR